MSSCFYSFSCNKLRDKVTMNLKALLYFSWQLLIQHLHPDSLVIPPTQDNCWHVDVLLCSLKGRLFFVRAANILYFRAQILHWTHRPETSDFSVWPVKFDGLEFFISIVIPDCVYLFGTFHHFILDLVFVPQNQISSET